MKLRDLFDFSLDVVNDFLSEARQDREAAAERAFACIAEVGSAHGEAAGRADFDAGVLRDNPQAGEDLLKLAFADCRPMANLDTGPDPYLTLSPGLIAAQALLLPTSANVGEAEYFRTLHTLDKAYANGYREGASERFDQQLDARLLPTTNSPINSPLEPGGFYIPDLATTIAAERDVPIYVPPNPSHSCPDHPVSGGAGAPSAPADSPSSSGGLGGGGGDSGG